MITTPSETQTMFAEMLSQLAGATVTVIDGRLPRKRNRIPAGSTLCG